MIVKLMIWWQRRWRFSFRKMPLSLRKREDGPSMFSSDDLVIEEFQSGERTYNFNQSLSPLQH